MVKPQNVIRRYMPIAAVIDMLRHRQFVLLDPATWDDRNDRYFMELYRQGRQLGGLYAACAATCFETYHHWRVFTSSADGACVEIYREPLEHALSGMAEVRFGEIDYLKLDEVEQLTQAHLNNLPFVKRIAFEPEKEYRIIVESSQPQEPTIAIQIPIAWVARILLNPWLPKRVADSVKATLKEIDGCSRLTVERSHLIENSRWKRAGEGVVGDRPRRPMKITRRRRF